MIGTNKEHIDQVLRDLVEIGVLSISAGERIAQSGEIHLTIYTKPNIFEDVKNYLSRVDVVSIEGDLAILTSEQTVMGLDFLGEIPLYVHDEMDYRDSETGELTSGLKIEEGLANLRSSFSPRPRDSLEDQLLPADFTGGVQV